MEQSPSREANGFSAIQEISRTLLNAESLITVLKTAGHLPLS
jgi:hypothetical protein